MPPQSISKAAALGNIFRNRTPMDPIDILFRAVGLFYVLAGWLGLRAVVMDAMLDKAIAAIGSSAEDPKEVSKRRVLACFSTMIGASGAALALLSFWALPLFLANIVLQAVWVAWARRFLVDTDEGDDARGRRQVINAAIVYAVATAGVVWLWREGHLGPWDDPVAVLGVLAVAAGLAIWFRRSLAWTPRPPLATEPDAYDAADDAGPPARVLIDPAFGYLPLVDADTRKRFNHWHWLPDTLAGRIEAWDDVFQLSFDPDDVTAANRFESSEQERAFEAEAMAIAAELGALYGPDNVAFGPGWDGDDPSPA